MFDLHATWTAIVAATPSATVTLRPEPSPSASATHTPTPTPTPPTYTTLPPLSQLVFQESLLTEYDPFLPEIFFGSPAPLRVDLSSQLEGECGVDCVKIAWQRGAATLTLTMIREVTPHAASERLAEAWQDFALAYPSWATHAIDSYAGPYDSVWAASERANLYYAVSRSQLFLLLRWTVEITGLDLDVTGMMGQLSCFGQYQLSILDAAASATTADGPITPSTRCMISY